MLACEHDSYDCLDLLIEEVDNVDIEDHDCLYYIAKADSCKSLITILA